MDSDARRQLEDLIDDAALTGFSVDRLRRLMMREQQRANGTIRISALPSFFACPSSRLPVKHPYNPPSDMAELGTAAHEALAAVVAGTIPDVHVVAKKHGVDVDELAWLLANGTLAWQELGLDSQHARPEYRLHGRGIAGTADVAYHDGVNATVVDWKTNRVKRTYRAQLTGYAAALADEFVPPESGEIRVVTVWLRFGEFETATITLDDIERFYEKLEATKLDVGKRYAPGDACTYCSRQLVCDARHEYLASAAAALVAAQHVELEPNILSSLYQQSKALRKALDHYDQALMMELRRAGQLPDANGHMLELTTMERDKIDPMKAWPILLEHGLTDEDIAQCVGMSKTSLLRMVGKDLKRGQKGKARGAFWQAMRDAGAVSKKVSETIQIVEKA